MAKRFLYPSIRKTTLGAKLRIALLPLNVRTPTSYTITVNQAFNSNTTPGIINLKSNQDVLLSSSNRLNFNGIIIEIAEEILITTLGVNVSIIDQPSNIIIPVNSTASTSALLLVHGCKNFTVSPDIQVIDTSNVSHGAEKEEKQTFNSKKISIDLIEIYGDTAGQLLKNMADNLIYRNYEFWFNYNYPDGSYKQGAALITSASYTENLHSIKNFKIDARVQPGTYTSNYV